MTGATKVSNGLGYRAITTYACKLLLHTYLNYLQHIPYNLCWYFVSLQATYVANVLYYLLALHTTDKKLVLVVSMYIYNYYVLVIYNVHCCLNCVFTITRLANCHTSKDTLQGNLAASIILWLLFLMPLINFPLLFLGTPLTSRAKASFLQI